MIHLPVYKNQKYFFLTILLLFSFYQDSLLAQAKNGEVIGYGKASYNAAQPGKFMKTWLLAGPVAVSADTLSPNDSLQSEIFKEDNFSSVNVVANKPLPSVTIKGKNIKWQLFSSADDIIDLDSFYQRKDFAYAYALAEINAPKAEQVFLGTGSDDGIKVWLNGKLVHDNWMPRGVTKDEDFVPLNLLKGTNQVLMKVQDMQGGWAFVARLLDKNALTEQLNKAAGSGNLARLKLLITNGADINAADKNGISPIVVAKISGRDDVVQALLKAGAKDIPVPSPEILVDDFYTSLKEKVSPGIAVLVAKDGKVLYRKGFGYENIKNKILITPDTKFRIGSVTKQFTASAILKLQENNLLSVHDKLSKFIPDFPRGDEVTIHELLTHTSGIHSYTSNNDFIHKLTQTISPDSLVNAIKKDPYDFNPREKWLYNNSGYFILGYIISKVSGKPYGEYLKENFFDPLNMKNTGVHYAGIKLKHEAKGYVKNGSGYNDATNWDMSWAGGAGALYSTVDDLLKWNEALYGGKVLKKESLEAALIPVVLKNGERASPLYGYGLGLSKFRGQDIISHGGGLHGFVTQLSYYPEEKLSVVMFSNTSEPEVNFDANKIAEPFLWDKMEKQTSYSETSFKPKNLQVYTGRYDLSGFAVVTISAENDKLYSQTSGQAKYEIFPMSEDQFFWKVVEAKIKFFKDEKGEISHATLFQNGQEINAKKLKEEAVINIDPSILDNYTGKYQYKPDVVLIVSKENNKLFAQPSGQSKLALEAVTETDFIIKEINAKLSFVKGENGKVNKIKLNLNGTDSELPKID
ncbi:MAG: serine hydrolase [Ginsengibacter sp.]